MGNARTQTVGQSIRPVTAAIALALLPGPALSASLGEADVRSFQGQPLDVRVAIDATPDVLGGDNLAAIAPNHLKLDESLARRVLVVRTPFPVERSGFRLDVRINCDGAQTSRSYALNIPPLPNFTQAALPVTAAPATEAPVRPQAAPAPQAAAPEEAAPREAPRGSLSITWTTAAGETLRAIARGLYPASVALQDAYIAKMRAENPALTQKPEEPLNAGLKITLPDMFAFANESPRYAKRDAPTESAAPVARAPDRPAPARSVAPQPASVASQEATPDKPKKISKAAKEPPPKPSAPAVPLVSIPRETKAPAAPAPSSATAGAVAPATLPASRPAGSGEFRLRLSGSEMDLSRSKGVSESTRKALRDKQLMFDADDQIAAFLALKNTVKELESRINEMQVVLSASTQLSAAPATKTAAALAKPASTQPATPAAPAIAAPAPATQVAPAKPAAPSVPEKKTESEPAKPTASAPAAPSVPAVSTPVPPLPAVQEKTVSSEPQPKAQPKAESSPVAMAPSATPAERPPQRPARVTEEPAWWDNVWLWIAGGLLLVVAIVYLIVRPRTPKSLLGSPSSALPQGRTSGFSNWASAPPAQEQDTDADEIRELVETRDRTDGLGASAEAHDRTVTFSTSRTGPASRPPSSPISAPQLPQHIGGPDDLGIASLELDTRPGMHIDFPLIGDDGAEDKARRLRYMEERFPELKDGTISIEDPDTVIDAARHYFEDGKLVLASELLTYSFEEHHGQLRYWLGLFEIFRLERKVTEFNALAVRFKNFHAGTDAWPKVQHIGRELDPLNPLYAAALGQLGVPEDQEFDPIAENWLNVPMDFASDALMSELRRSILSEHGVEPAELKRLSVASRS
jgi:hypothetical protein